MKVKILYFSISLKSRKTFGFSRMNFFVKSQTLIVSVNWAKTFSCTSIVNYELRHIQKEMHTENVSLCLSFFFVYSLCFFLTLYYNIEMCQHQQ